MSRAQCGRSTYGPRSTSLATPLRQCLAQRFGSTGLAAQATEMAAEDTVLAAEASDLAEEVEEEMVEEMVEATLRAAKNVVLLFAVAVAANLALSPRD